MSPRVRPEFKPDETVVAWTGFAFADTVIGEGTRLRGDHEAVKAAPSNFVRDGTASDEMPDVFGEPDETTDNPQALEAQLYGEPIAYSQPDLRVLARDVRVGVGVENGRAARVVELKAGARFLADAEIVRLRPDLFENGKP